MVADSRRQNVTIKDEFLSKPYEFEFHQAIKIIEAFRLNTEKIGEGTFSGKEAVKINSRVFLDWPPSDVYSVLFPDDDFSIPQLNINFFGIAGAQGPLPIRYTELIMERVRKRDCTFRDFLDIFNHRLVSVLHRIRKKHWLGLSDSVPEKTQVGRCLFSFCGLGIDRLHDRMSVSDRSILSYSGLFWQKPASSSGLQAILGSYFNTLVNIEQLKGKWRCLEKDQVTRIGKIGTFNSLAKGSMLGTKVWDQEGHIVIKIGPLNFNLFCDFLKNGKAYKPLCDITKFYIGKVMDFSFNLVVLAKDVKKTKLDGKSFLGWTSWLKVKESKENDSQVFLYPSNI